MADATPYDEYCRGKEEQIQFYMLHKKLPKTMQDELRRFRAEFLINRKLAIPTHETYIMRLSFFGQWLAEKGYKSCKEATREDIADYLGLIANKSSSVQMWAKTALKVFYRWLLTGGISRRDKYPDIIGWVCIGTPKYKEITAEDVLKPEEVKAMLQCAKNPRDRAIIALLVDSGMRLGEITNLRVKDVNMNEEMPFIRITRSKSKPRLHYMVDSLHEVLSWYDRHPDKLSKNFEESFLFVPVYHKEGLRKYMDGGVVRRLLRRIADRAGIKRRIWTHLFRHTQTTYDVNSGLSDTLIKLRRGDSPNSRMIQRYAHSTTKDAAKTLLKLRGVFVEEKKDQMQSRNCLRCQRVNAWTAEYCLGCGAVLDEDKYRHAIEDKENQKGQMSRMQEQIDKLMVLAAHGTVLKAKIRAEQAMKERRN